MRIGIGYDLHPLVPGRALVLGGVELEFDRGLKGHSDADALTHAVIDALLGAAGLGTIGQHFPDTDERLRGASSLDLLETTGRLLAAAGYRVVNVDSVVVAERPRLQDRLEEMGARLAARLGIAPADVSVKATSPEHIGALGREEAIAAQAVALLEANR